jgi:replicative DNA helicase
VNLASILLKAIITESDLDTWADLHKHYLPREYQSIWSFIDKHVEEFRELPSFDAVQLSVRDNKLRERLLALQNVESVDIDNHTLLEYLKNEFTQLEIMTELEDYLENSIAMESAKENIESLQNIILKVEDKVDLKGTAESMQRMELFYSKEYLDNVVPLGLNVDYDEVEKFGPEDYVLIGGKRGQGKSIVCANIASTTYQSGSSVMYFTIEMSARETMQRICAISTGVNAKAIENNTLGPKEQLDVAQWWASRFEEGEKLYNDWVKSSPRGFGGLRDFSLLHNELSKNPLRPKQVDIVYESGLTLANIRKELDKKVPTLQPKVVIVDYVNQVKRGFNNSRMGQYDWTEQIEVSKALKAFAQDYGILVISPYQIDATGEARFAKGILDSPDAAFTLEASKGDNPYMKLNCTKMRSGDDDTSFASEMDWSSLKIGPNSIIIPEDGDDPEEDDIHKALHG